MNTYRVFSVEGKTLRFRGNLISTVNSRQIETPSGGLRFELNAYEREPQSFVITISVLRSHSEVEEVFDFYNTDSLSAAEDFLYDFDPAVLFSKDFLAASGSMQTSPVFAADHAYYAATRRLIRELNDHAARQHVLRGSASHSGLPEGNRKIVNRFRDLFGI